MTTERFLWCGKFTFNEQRESQKKGERERKINPVFLRVANFNNNWMTSKIIIM